KLRSRRDRHPRAVRLAEGLRGICELLGPHVVRRGGDEVSHEEGGVGGRSDGFSVDFRRKSELGELLWGLFIARKAIGAERPAERGTLRFVGRKLAAEVIGAGGQLGRE